MHIENLYRDKTVLMFKQLYAMEKIHGTSAHILVNEGHLTYFSGGVKQDEFVKLFDHERLSAAFERHTRIVIYGEAYGGKCQKMSDIYGPALRFVAFDVKINDKWLSVPDACDLVTGIGLEFVDFVTVTTDLDELDRERDRPSVQAVRNGMGEGHCREGVVLRPLMELNDNRGNRIIAKHKQAGFRETAGVHKVSADKQAIIAGAIAIAAEYVVPMRLNHVLARVGLLDCYNVSDIPIIITAMIEDVRRESDGEVVWSRDVERAIGNATAALVKDMVQQV